MRGDYYYDDVFSNLAINSGSASDSQLSPKLGLIFSDDSVRSKATGTVNARAGYKFLPKLRLSVEIYNLTNRRDSGIDYAYESRLPEEGKFDVHFHPIESRSIRVNLIANF